MRGMRAANAAEDAVAELANWRGGPIRGEQIIDDAVARSATVGVACDANPQVVLHE